MTDKFHGFAAPGQHVTGSLDFYKVVTTLDITPLESTEAGTYIPEFKPGTFATNYQDTRVVDSQLRLDKLVEVISSRAQPVIMYNIKKETADDTVATDSGLAAASKGAQIFTMIFAIEHGEAWEIHNGNFPTLNDSLNGILDFVHTTPDSNNNIAVYRIAADKDQPKVR